MGHSNTSWHFLALYRPPIHWGLGIWKRGVAWYPYGSQYPDRGGLGIQSFEWNLFVKWIKKGGESVSEQFGYRDPSLIASSWSTTKSTERDLVNRPFKWANFKRKHDNKGIGNNLNQNRSHKVFINIYSSTSSTLINYNLLARKLFTHDCNVSTSNVM